MDSKCESLCEDASEILQEIIAADAQLQIWFDSNLDFGHSSLIDACLGNLPRLVASRSIEKQNDKSSLLIRIPKALTRIQIDMSIERIFAKEMSFEIGRQTRNLTCSNARSSLSNPIKVETYKMAFDVYEQILLTESDG